MFRPQFRLDPIRPMTRLRPDLPALAHVDTPALIIDEPALQANIERMAKTAAARKVALRPHAKTHKSADIALRQLEAGAIGIACATLLEAEALAERGVTGLLLTSPVVGADRAARVARLNRVSPLAVVVDHRDQFESLRAALGEDDPPLGLLVDVDVGQGRTGVATLQDGHALARLAAGDRRFAFRGLQGYAGHIQHVFEATERRAAAAKAVEPLRSLTALLAADGIACPVVSGSGTGAHAFDMGGPYTELQVGSYVFMDADYGRVRQEDGSPLPFEPALYVLATVVSSNREGHVTVDAGTKALAVNGPPPSWFIGVPPGASYAFSGDEHGAITLPPGAARPVVGARVLIGATHCDPTVNLHSAYHAVAADGSVTMMPIVGRYGAMAAVAS
jgi:D-serine deaminase-like pyridoxal phosphate-dependent protein